MKLKDLDLLLKEIDETSAHMQELSNELRAMFTTSKEQEAKEKEVTFTELRALCANKSREGFTATIKDMIYDTGAKKLSEVEPNRYSELYRRVEGLK